MKNSPATCTFQRLVSKVIPALDGVGAYIDDVIMYSNTGKNIHVVCDLSSTSFQNIFWQQILTKVNSDMELKLC